MDPEQNDVPATPVAQWWQRVSKPRLVLFAIIALVVLAFVLSFVRAMLGSFSSTAGHVAQYPGFPAGEVYDAPMMAVESLNHKGVERSIAPAPDYDGGAGSFDESEYETQAYRATYHTSEFDSTCDQLELLKPRTDVVFEYANRSDARCSYHFKVERGVADQVLAELESLNPDELFADTQTVKQQVVDHETGMQLLLRKEAMLQQMLSDASNAYDSLAELATGAGDVESLTTIINSKLQQINQLTRELQTVSSQIDAMARSQSQLSDRIDYVQFSATVYKYEVVNLAGIKDSWVSAAKEFVVHLNSTLQALTLGFLGLLLTLVQFVLFALVIIALFLFVGKHGWRVAKQFWQS